MKTCLNLILNLRCEIFLEDSFLVPSPAGDHLLARIPSHVKFETGPFTRKSTPNKQKEYKSNFSFFG